MSQADCNSLGIDEPVRNCGDGLICVEHMCTAPACEIDADCGGQTPFCAPDQTCVGCREDADCSGSAPVCDEMTRDCRGCTADSECASQACDFETGSCLATAAVIYASPAGTDLADCSQQTPCSITKAISAASSGRPTVKLASGVYNANVRIDRPTNIHGEGATLIAVPGVLEPTVYVVDAANARIYGLSIVNNNTSGSANAVIGLFCGSEDGINTPRISLDRVSIDTQRTPMAFNLCRLTVQRSTLKSPRNTMTHITLLGGNEGSASFDRVNFIGGGNIVMYGAHATITNSVLDELLGPPAEGVVGTTVGGSVSISYSTIYNSPMTCGGSDLPACASAARVGVCVDNTIINKPSSLADAVSGTNCLFNYTAVSPQMAAVPGSNNIIGMNPDFVDPVAKNFHLKAGSHAIDAANSAMNGTADYDGTMRPQGTRSDLGAFEFKP